MSSMNGDFVFEITPSEFEELEAKHGELYEAETALGTCIFRGMSEAEYAQMQDAFALGGAQRRNAVKKAALRCVVFPKREELEKHMQKHPALALLLTNAINSVAEASEIKRAKKPESISTE